MSMLGNAFRIAWSDTKARYKSSILGPLWPTLTNVFGILGLGLVWGTLMHQDMNVFIPQLTIGLVVWQLISGALVDGPTVFIRQANIIRNVAIPQWFFVVRLLSRLIINLLHNALIIIAVALWFGLGVSKSIFFLIPGLFLVILNLYWIVYGLGMLGARFRDVEHLIVSIVPMIFFMSPVIYRADAIPKGLALVWLNPFTYMIEILRLPMLGVTPDNTDYLVLIVMALLGSATIHFFKARYGKSLAFWV